MKADYVHKDSKTSTNETISYKITMPLINDEELQRIDNNYNELVDEFIKQFVKEKDMIIAQRIMMNLRKENKQLLRENEKLKEQLKQKEDIINKAKEYIINNSLYEEEYDYDYEENIYLSGIHDDDVRRILVEILDNKGE